MQFNAIFTKAHQFDVFAFFIRLNVTFDENKQNWEHLNISFRIFFV